MGDQLAELSNVARLQNESFRSLLQLSQAGARDDLFEDFLSRARAHLEAADAYERAWPGTIDLAGAARPLVQQLSMYADHREAAGDRQYANHLRSEADALTERYLRGAAAAQMRRTRAMEAASAGKFREALVGLDESHRAFAAGGERIEAAQTLVQLANVYEWLSAWQRSLDTLDAAADLVADELGGGPPSAEEVERAIQEQQAGILAGRGDGRQGETALGLRRLHYEVLQARARLNRRLGNLDQALAQFEEARPFAEEVSSAGLNFHLAALAVDRGDFANARMLLTAIEPAFDSGLFRPRRGALRQIQADVALGEGRPEEALALATDGLADQATYPDLDLEWKLQWRVARALSATARADEAMAAYKQAATAVDQLRMAPLGYELDSTFVRESLPMMEQAIDAAVAAGDGVSAVWFVELVKSRALAAVLSLPGRADDADDPDEVQFDQLSERVDALAFAMYSGGASAEQVRERNYLLAERRALLERIRIRDPRWRTMTQPPPLDVAAIDDLLRASGRVALVLHLRGPQIVAAVAGGPEGMVVGSITCTDETMAALQTYVDNLHKASPDWFLADLSGELGLTLESLLPERVLRAVVDAEVVLVVPHRQLHLVPWSVLTVRNHRLFEHSAVGVLPNLAALAELDLVGDAAHSVALLGDPDYAGLARYRQLTQTGPELTDLEELYGDDLLAPSIRGAAATESALVALLQEPGAEDAILHVACHADAEADEPMASGLILTGSKLDCAEILQHRCDFTEVVLSACSTGWRPQSVNGLDLSGDDALGLVASFLEAGARSLLVSITQASDDMARRFTVAWHRRRRQRATPLAAYRSAQVELLLADPDNVWKWAGLTAYATR